MLKLLKIYFIAYCKLIPLVVVSMLSRVTWA